MKESYDCNTLVKIILKSGKNAVTGIVEGGQRYMNGDLVNFLNFDGFYSYTVKVVNLHALPGEHTEGNSYTIVLASEILAVDFLAPH